MNLLRRRGWQLGAAFIAGVSMAACAGESGAPGLLAAKGGGTGAGPKVTAAEPASGLQGERLVVRILGSGYNSTAVASWERNGAPDPKITVHSTTFVSSSELQADITIATDADTVVYDIGVEIMLSDGSRKKGVGIEKFTVSNGNGASGPSIPYYLTLWGAILTNPTADAVPLAQEQVVYAWSVQPDSLQLTIRHDWPDVGRAATAFVNTKAASSLTACKKGSKQLSNAEALALLESFVRTDAQPPQGVNLWVDSPAMLSGLGSGRVGMYFLETNPSSPFYQGEIHVKIFYNDRVAPAWGPPKVTLESTNGTESVYRFHAGFGTANIWWRGGGPYATINCPLLDDVYVKVRPGF